MRFGSLCIVLCLATVLASVAFGIIVGNWAPLVYCFIILVLAWTTLQFTDLLKNVPFRNSKVYRKAEEGNVLVDFHCSEHVFGYTPFFVDIAGVRVARIYHGDSVSVPLLLGSEDVTIHLADDTKHKIDRISNDMTVHLWVNYGTGDEYIQVKTFCTKRGGNINGDGEYDEGRVKESFEARRKMLRGFAITQALQCVWALPTIVLLALEYNLL